MKNKEKKPTQDDINQGQLNLINSIFEDLQVKNETIRGMQIQISQIMEDIQKLKVNHAVIERNPDEKTQM